MKKFAVIGVSGFGFYVAKALFEAGHEVLAIDMDRHRIQAVDPYADQAVVLDATDRESLATMGLEEMDSVIVSTGARVHASVLICLYLSELGVENIVVQSDDLDQEKILRKVGASRIVHPERDMGYKMAETLTSS